MAIEERANMMEREQFRKWKHVDKRRGTDEMEMRGIVMDRVRRSEGGMRGGFTQTDERAGERWNRGGLS